MPMSPNEAQQVLNDIARTERRSWISFGYDRGAPHFFVWGAIWVAGYSLTARWPDWSGTVWLVLNTLGFLASATLARQTRFASTGTNGWSGPTRPLAVGAALFLFMIATFYVMAPRDPAQFAAFPPLVIALTYVLFGLFWGARWVVAGTALGALTIAGYMFFRDHMLVWMAVFGGGTLLSTGLWLRRT